MYILKTFLRENIGENMNYSKLVGIQYFEDSEFSKVKSILVYTNKRFKEKNLNLKCEMQKL